MSPYLINAAKTIGPLASIICASSCGVHCLAGQAKSAKHTYFTNKLGLKFVYIPGGQFTMGHVPLAGPLRKVKVSGFWMSVTEITNAQFRLLFPHKYTAESDKPDDPVDQVTFAEAEKFAAECQKKAPGNFYRLPTEAEWEYAARGGLKAADYPWGNDDESGRAVTGKSHTERVGSYKPNGYGLYDMDGNVSEYVLDDCYRSTDLKGSKAILNNPLFLERESGKSSPWKISKGGDYSNWNNYLWLSNPVEPHGPVDELNGQGFRLVMTKTPSKFTKVYFHETGKNGQ